jgi:hypothetical protein
MEDKKKLAYTFVCLGLAFLGVFHLVFSTLFGYGLQAVGGLLIGAGLFGLLVINA